MKRKCWKFYLIYHKVWLIELIRKFSQIYQWFLGRTQDWLDYHEYVEVIWKSQRLIFLKYISNPWVSWIFSWSHWFRDNEVWLYNTVFIFNEPLALDDDSNLCAWFISSIWLCIYTTIHTSDVQSELSELEFLQRNFFLEGTVSRSYLHYMKNDAFMGAQEWSCRFRIHPSWTVLMLWCSAPICQHFVSQIKNSTYKTGIIKCDAHVPITDGLYDRTVDSKILPLS